MDVFNDLGARVAGAWSKCRFEPEALPEIAAVELQRQPLHHAVDYRSILAWLNSTETLPFQANFGIDFGEPPLTLFWHPSFYIEALFWHTSTTSIHGHGFSGAFQVLTGTSVQSLFEFDAPVQQRRCRVGHLRQREVALLRPGATQMIRSGDRFIHSIFHLGYPSVTIVIRNRGSSESQYSYYRPSVAVLHNITFDQLTTRLLEVARLQAAIMSDDLKATVARIGARCELAAAFKLLRTVQVILYKQKRVEMAADLILSLAANHGHATITKLAQAVVWEGHLRRLWQARDSIIDDELRLVLALLLTQQTRASVLDLTAAYMGAREPSETVAKGITALAAKGVLNIPSDGTTTRLLQVWLERGRNAAFRDKKTFEHIDNTERTIQRLSAEPLLSSLLHQAAPRVSEPISQADDLRQAVRADWA